MLLDIKHTFTSAIFFGFTCTPILVENQKNSITDISKEAEQWDVAKVEAKIK